MPDTVSGSKSESDSAVLFGFVIFLGHDYLYFLELISAQNIFGRNLAENVFRSGSGSGHFRKSDPVKNRPDPQH
jgi:hypothetical protein